MIFSQTEHSYSSIEACRQTHNDKLDFFRHNLEFRSIPAKDVILVGAKANCLTSVRNAANLLTCSTHVGEIEHSRQNNPLFEDNVYIWFSKTQYQDGKGKGVVTGRMVQKLPARLT